MKKGEMSTTALITMIVLVVSVLILAFLYFRYPWSTDINKEVCHESIVKRATFNAGPFEPGKNIIPLKCRTEKVCITDSGKACPDLPQSTRDSPVETISIKSGDDARQIVLDTIAEKMYDCHDILGRGNLDFMPHTFTQKNYCFICSRIAFDDEVKQAVPSITYAELYRYLQQKKTDDGQSYLRFIYSGWDNWEASRDLFEQIKEKNPSMKNMRYEDWKIQLNAPGGQAIIVQELPTGTWKSWATGAGAVVATGLILTGVGAPVGVAIISGASLGGYAFFKTDPSGQFEYMAPTPIQYNTQQLKALNCDSFETQR